MQLWEFDRKYGIRENGITLFNIRNVEENQFLRNCSLKILDYKFSLLKISDSFFRI